MTQKLRLFQLSTQILSHCFIIFLRTIKMSSTFLSLICTAETHESVVLACFQVKNPSMNIMEVRQFLSRSMDNYFIENFLQTPLQKPLYRLQVTKLCSHLRLFLLVFGMAGTTSAFSVAQFHRVYNKHCGGQREVLNLRLYFSLE